MNVPGENLPKVFHYFKEAHPYFDKDVCVLAGKIQVLMLRLNLLKLGQELRFIPWKRVLLKYKTMDFS